jgi:inosine-uridine nucleoside N-ribohydrolase
MLCPFAGAVTLLCLGPLTNVALAIRMDPNFCTNVKEIFIMGGNIEGKCGFMWHKRAVIL